MKFSTAIFLSAWEQRGPETSEEHEGLGPALFAIEPRVLGRLIAEHATRRSPAGSIPWNAFCCPSCREVAFDAWHWSVRDHTWTQVFLRCQEIFADSEGYDVQMVASLSPKQNVTSTPLNSSAMAKLAAKGDSEGKFLLATKDNLYTFQEFESFEFLFRQHLEGTWGLSAEYCSIDEDSLTMPEELP